MSREKKVCRRLAKAGLTFAVALCMFATVLMPVRAAEKVPEKTYKVIVRAGSQGSFENNSSKYETDVVAGKALSDAEITDILGKLSVNSGYYVKETELRGRLSGSVAKRTEETVSYGLISDPAEIALEYLDVNSRESISTARVYTTDGTEADRIKKEPEPLRRTVSGYTARGIEVKDTPADSASGIKVRKLEISFLYVNNNALNVTEETVYERGADTSSTEYVTEEQVTYIGAGTAGGGAGAGGAETIDDEEVPLADITADEGGQEEERQDETVRIEDEEVPLAGPEEGSSHTAIYITLGGIALLAAVIAVLFAVKKKEKEMKDLSE